MRTISDPNARFGITFPEIRRRWQVDRELQNHLQLSGRGLLGLAVLLDQPDDTFYSGPLALVRNNRLTWLTLRDVPCDLDPRRYSPWRPLATATVARLRYGLPSLTFTADDRCGLPTSIDLSLPPPGGLGQGDATCESNVYERAWSALVATSEAMTYRALRWRTPAADCPPSRWLPRPLLAFPASMSLELTQAIATEAANPRSMARLSFEQDLAQGLALGAVGPEVYLGVRQPDRASQSIGNGKGNAPIGWTPHLLRSLLTHRDRTVWLPPKARVVAQPNQVLEAGQVWAWACQRLAPTDRLHRIDPFAVTVHQLWASHRLVQVEAEPNSVLVATDDVATAVAARKLPSPANLWWDTTAMVRAGRYGWQVQAATFPPIELRRWDATDLELPGQIRLNIIASHPSVRPAKPAANHPKPRRHQAARIDVKCQAKISRRRSSGLPNPFRKIVVSAPLLATMPIGGTRAYR